jgi:Zn-dependent peptidase ImmA (M78 family)/DNA-binding XRE family transcriptional regulator
MNSANTFKLSTSVLEWARVTRGFSIEQAAKKAGVSNERYVSWENGEKKPTYKQLETLAESVYKRSIAFLFLKTPPQEDSIIKDFRTLSNVEVNDLTVDLRLVLRRAKRFQLILDEVNIHEIARFKDFQLNLNDDPETISFLFREFLDFSIEEQYKWKNSEEAFINLKSKIESLGIFIFQLKMNFYDARAFCLTGKNPVIVLNTDDSKNGRIFSLFHEVCHVLLNTNSIFKDLKIESNNKNYELIENFCNTFAASFLVPNIYFDKEIELKKSNWTEEDIFFLSNRYNVSKEVIARKLLSKKLLTENNFWIFKKKWDALAIAAKEQINEKLKDKDSKGFDQSIKIISEKGKPYVGAVISAYQKGNISSADLSNYLEAKIDHLPKLLNRLTN